MDSVTVNRMTSDDRGSAAKASRNGNGAASIFDCPGLSIRECGILELIGQGYSNKGVARALGISAETVKSHVKRVFIKLDVNTRAHAVARAQSLGLFGLKFIRPLNVMAARETRDSISA
jgi:ATP/maltotriose-dependent transcriptional regulator MalT